MAHHFKRVQNICEHYYLLLQVMVSLLWCKRIHQIQNTREMSSIKQNEPTHWTVCCPWDFLLDQHMPDKCWWHPGALSVFFYFKDSHCHTWTVHHRLVKEMNRGPEIKRKGEEIKKFFLPKISSQYNKIILWSIPITLVTKHKTAIVTKSTVFGLRQFGSNPGASNVVMQIFFNLSKLKSSKLRRVTLSLQSYLRAKNYRVIYNIKTARQKKTPFQLWFC